MSSTTIPTPVVESSRTYYGVQVVDVGEDGDILVLGQGLPTRRVLAALNAHARYLGYELGDTYADAVANLKASWAQLTTECCGIPVENPEEPTVCPDDGRLDRPEFEWCADYFAREGVPGAFPVLVWSA